MLTYSLLGLTAVLAALYLYKSTRGAAAARMRWSDHRGTFLHFAFVFALGFVTVAFEYETAWPVLAKAPPLPLEPALQIETVQTADARRPALPLPLPPAPPTPPLFTPEDPAPLSPETSVERASVEPPPATSNSTPRPRGSSVPPPPIPPPPFTPPAAPELFDVVEDMPRFPGCEDLPALEREPCAAKALIAYVSENFRYPVLARENGVSGQAVVTFVVEPDGSISTVRAVRDPGAGIAREAKRVVADMPPWIPGRQRGRPVRVRFTIPIRLHLD